MATEAVALAVTRLDRLEMGLAVAHRQILHREKMKISRDSTRWQFSGCETHLQEKYRRTAKIFNDPPKARDDPVGQRSKWPFNFA